MKRLIGRIPTFAAYALIATLMIYGITKADFHVSLYGTREVVGVNDANEAFVDASRALANGELIRLHIIADSDDEFDQWLKLTIRDAILAAFASDLEGETHDDASRRVQSLIPEIESLAREVAVTNGYEGGIEASFGRESFPERVYAGFHVPAGEYDSLIVRIGSASGKNWWCVMYPPLCLLTPDAPQGVQSAKAIEVDEPLNGVESRVDTRTTNLSTANLSITNLSIINKRDPHNNYKLDGIKSRIEFGEMNETKTSEPMEKKPVFYSAIARWFRGLF